MECTGVRKVMQPSAVPLQPKCARFSHEPPCGDHRGGEQQHGQLAKEQDFGDVQRLPGNLDQDNHDREEQGTQQNPKAAAHVARQPAPFYGELGACTGKRQTLEYFIV